MEKLTLTIPSSDENVTAEIDEKGIKIVLDNVNYGLSSSEQFVDLYLECERAQRLAEAILSLLEKIEINPRGNSAS